MSQHTTPKATQPMKVANQNLNQFIVSVLIMNRVTRAIYVRALIAFSCAFSDAFVTNVRDISVKL